MPSTRIPITTIESWTPAIDARSVENGSLFVLAGRNYLFDAKGPRSGFGSSLVSDVPLDVSAEQVEFIRIANRTIVLTGVGAFERRPWGAMDGNQGVFTSNSDDWFQLASWETQPEYDMGIYGWTSAYVGFGAYLNHPGYGLFRLMGDSLVPFEPIGIDGEKVLAIAESAGRLILLTNTMISYSNADDASDLTPELGGAGFQITAQRVPGTPYAITSFQNGFITWTSSGVLVAEFVGGETVFRFDRVITEQFMLSPRSWETLASGDVVIVTKQGLFLSSATRGLEPYSELFNEYLRKMLSDSDNYQFRLNYFKEEDLLFVQVTDSGPHFSKTFVYHQASQKWGEFNEFHKGIIRFGNQSGEYGYVDTDGYLHHFDESSSRQGQDGNRYGLDSYVSIGYLRPANGAEWADVNFETQQILISAIRTAVDTQQMLEEDWNGPNALVSFNLGFYAFDSDWSGFGVDAYDISFNDPAPDEDWSTQTLPDVDFNDIVAGQRDFDWNDDIYIDADWALTPDGGVETLVDEDWGYVESPMLNEEDWGGIASLLNKVDYSLEMHCDLDGFDSEVITTPVKAVSRNEADLWTLLSHGHNQRLIVAAIQPNEKFHVTSLAFSVTYAGHLG